MLRCTGDVLLVAKRQQTQLPAQILFFLIKYLSSVKSRSEGPLGNLGTATRGLAGERVLGYQVLDSERRVRLQILCVTTYGESCTGHKMVSQRESQHRGKLQSI